MARPVSTLGRFARSGLLLTAPIAALCVLVGACSSGKASEEVTSTVGAANQDPGASGAADATPSPTDPETTLDENPSSDSSLETVTLGTGCFWCTEAVLEQVEGVRDVVSGYMGGDKPNPTYKEICTGRTGHAEVVQVSFDPEVLPFEDLMAWFWKMHDPTTLNRQGADVGTQYRSAVFFHSEAQREIAERSMQAAQADFSDPIVTELTPASEFYVAEDYHQDYYRANKQQGYCRAVIAPKLDKLKLEK